MLRELCSDPSFGVELFLNYDCDIQRSNVFGVLLALLMQLAAPRIPSPRGSYRLTEYEMDGVHGHLGSGGPLSPQTATVAPITSDVPVAKTPQPHHSPSSSSPSSVSSSIFGESAKSHHHGAFHLRRAPQRAPLRPARFTADSGAAATAAATETLATDAAGVTRPAGLSNVNRLALAAILRIIASLASRCDNMRRNKREQQPQVEKPQLDKESAAAYFLRIQEAQSLAQRRKNKAVLSLGAAAFNANTKEAIARLEGLGLLPTPATPKSVALFLKETRGLDLRTVGLYLSANKPWNTEVCRRSAVSRSSRNPPR